MPNQSSAIGGSPNEVQGPPPGSTVSSISSSNFVEGATRLSNFSSTLRRPETLHEIHKYRRRPNRTDLAQKPTGDTGVLDNPGNRYSRSSRDSRNSSLGIFSRGIQFKMPRMSFSKRDTVTSHLPTSEVGTAELASSAGIFAGEPFSHKSFLWRRIWNSKDPVSEQNNTKCGRLSLNAASISGAVYKAGDEEAAWGGDNNMTYCPKIYIDCSGQCSQSRDIQSKRPPWLTIVSLTLSTFGSALWLISAFIKPKWGHHISSNGTLTPSSATMLVAGIAKAIELSFIATFIAFLGQALTRRAISRRSRGVTLAEISMRSWVIQPSYILTSMSMVKPVAPSILGAISLMAAFVAAIYTTASNAILAPKLKYGPWEHKVLSGYVRASYANPQYLEMLCPSMLTESDAENGASACTDVMISGDSYKNLQSFMHIWAEINNNGSASFNKLPQRPAGIASLRGNTTLRASWIETENSDVMANYMATGRIINNVTMAMPHPSVAFAAMSPLNGILQPSDLDGVGEYAIKAGVVSPAVNVICVNMKRDELMPLVYTEWPTARTYLTGVGEQRIGWANWTSELPDLYDSDGQENFLNRTVLDDTFRWGPEYKRRPPVFQLFPADYNIVTNSTVLSSDSIYLLAKSPKLRNYTLCELRSWVSPNCSTHFNISGLYGSRMAAHCEDPGDQNSYWKSFPRNQGWPMPSPDWRWLADKWRLATDLDGGRRNSNTSNARILTQLILTDPTLPTYLPSMAEALAVFASSTLVLGSIDTPFRHYWEYHKPGNVVGEPGVVHQFNASISTQEYTSGCEFDALGIFFTTIMLLMFALSLGCCVYIVAHYKFVTDYTDMPNLFVLALNSGQGKQLQDRCGSGAQHGNLVVPWRIGYTRSKNHYFIEQAAEEAGGESGKGAVIQSNEADTGHSIGESYSRLSKTRAWL